MDVTRSAEPPLVSVITIFLNAEAFLAQAIRSVFGQTYPHWELLLIDDGSADRGTEIARGHADRDPDRVRYFEHPGHSNRGMSASRNLGIRNARGSLLALLDADDVWLPHKLHQQVEILASRPDVGIVYGRSRYWFGWTGRAEDVRRDVTPEFDVAPGTVVKPPGLLLINYPLGGGKAPCPSDLLFRANMIGRTGAFEEEFVGDLQLYEDQVFLAKVYLKEKVYVSGETWDLYRQHLHSCVSVVKQAGRYNAVRKYFLNWLGEYLTREGIHDEGVWRALRKAQWPYAHPALDAALRTGRRLYRPLRRRAARLARRLLGAPAPSHQPPPPRDPANSTSP